MQTNLFFEKVGAYLKATWVRFFTESPRYWRTLQHFFNWLTGVTILLSDYGQHIIVGLTGYGLDVPHWFQVAMGYVATAAALARIVSGFPINRDAVSERKYEALQDPAKTVQP